MVVSGTMEAGQRRKWKVPCGRGCYQDGDGGSGGFRDRISPLKQNMSPAPLLKNKPVSILGAGMEKHRRTVFTGTH